MSEKAKSLMLGLLLLAVIGVIVGCIACVPRRAGPSPGPTDPAQPPLRSADPVVTVTVPPGPGTYSWAFAPMQAGGQISGSLNGNLQTGSIESVVKTWLAADYLRQHDTVTVMMLTELRTMIRESDDDYAQDLYERLGADESINRMITVCKLRNTRVVPFWWSLTRTTSADLVRLGWCIASGGAAGSVWTPWLLDVMRTEHHAGQWGIVQGVMPQELQPKVAYMNGWTEHGDWWQVNCLAIGPTWILAVLANYPSTSDESHGAAVCADVARQLTSVLPPPPSSEPAAAMLSPS